MHRFQYFYMKTAAVCRFIHYRRDSDALYLYIDDGSKLAEVLVELGDIVEVSRDLSNLQLCVHVVIPLRKAVLMLVVKVCPETESKMFFFRGKY